MCSTKDSKYYKASTKDTSTWPSSNQTFAPKIETTSAHACRFVSSNSTKIMFKQAYSKVMKLRRQVDIVERMPSATACWFSDQTHIQPTLM